MDSYRRNVLFITCDQLRADCLNGSFVKTPHLDALARESVSFARHYCQSTPCAPARAALHTGCYLMNNHVQANGSPLTAALTNWAKEAREQGGFDPVLIGYVDQVLDTTVHDPNDPRFKDCQNGEGGYLSGLRRLTDTDGMGSPDWLHERGIDPAGGSHKNGWNGYQGVPTWLALRRSEEDCAPFPQPAQYKAEDSDTRVLTDRAMTFIEDQHARRKDDSEERGWILHLSLLKPHPPWVAPHPFNRMYNPTDIQKECPTARASSAEEEALSHPWLQMWHEISGFAKNQTEKRLLLNKSNYFALVSELDSNLGRLLDHLKTTEQYEETLIVFTCDHGEQLGDHWMWGKLGFFESSYHIPLIVRDPFRKADLRRGSTVQNAFTESIDVMPTILEWLGLRVPLQCDGRSLLSLIRMPLVPAGWRNAAHWEVNYSSWMRTRRGRLRWMGQELPGVSSPDDAYFCVLREERYKLVHFRGGLPPLLFDLHSDPWELRNRASDPELRGVLLRLTQDMLQWHLAYSGAGGRELLHSKVTDRVVSRL